MEKTETKFSKTITSMFMVPTLKINKDDLKNNGFINGFSRDAIKDVEYENAIYLLFRPSQVDMFREFLDKEYERTKQLIDDYDHPKGFVVLVYKLNPEYSKDFSLIREGKYSRTSEAFQKEFPKIVKIFVGGLHRDEISLQYRVFNKTQDLIDFWENKFGMKFDESMELWERYKEEEETLTMDKLEQYEQQHD